jgi:hypothetical protein
MAVLQHNLTTTWKVTTTKKHILHQLFMRISQVVPEIYLSLIGDDKNSKTKTLACWVAAAYK